MTDLPLRLTPAIRLEQKAVSETGLLTGYGSTFNSPPDAFGDVVQPGAFKASLAKHRTEGTSPKMLWAHNTDEPIGVWQDMHEDDRGLRVKGQLTLETQRGREAHALLRAGALDGLSIGFAIPDDGVEPASDGTRLLREVDLWEVSIVTFPANRHARIDGVKSMADLEALLRSQGLARRAASKVARAGWDALGGRMETADDELLQAIAAGRSTLNSILRRFQWIQ